MGAPRMSSLYVWIMFVCSCCCWYSCLSRDSDAADDAAEILPDELRFIADAVGSKFKVTPKVERCWIEVDERSNLSTRVCEKSADSRKMQVIGRDSAMSRDSLSEIRKRSPAEREHRRMRSAYVEVPSPSFSSRHVPKDVDARHENDASILITDGTEDGSQESRDRRLPYGDDRRTDGRLPNTKCDWLLIVDDCVGHCELVSPGYPGTYPHNSHCSYLVTSFDESRVELTTSGRDFTGKFDVRMSHQCVDDHLAIYDGLSANDPLIGRFCGRSLPHIISNGPGLYVMFYTANKRGSNRSKHTGFHLHALARWRNHHEGGRRVVGTACDWAFSSLDAVKGEFHTPDSVLFNATICRYQFDGVDENDRVELQVIAEQRKPQPLQQHQQQQHHFPHLYQGDVTSAMRCDETISFYESSLPPGSDVVVHQVPPICVIVVDSGFRSAVDRAPVTGTRRVQSGYNSTGNKVQIVYRKSAEHLSNPDPTWIYFRFWRKPTVRNIAPSDDTRSNHTAVVSPQKSDGMSTSAPAPENVTSIGSKTSPSLRKCSCVVRFLNFGFFFLKLMVLLNE